MPGERQAIGQGIEHTVVTPILECNQGEVLKRPHRFNALTLHYLFGGEKTVRREIDDFREMVSGKENLEVVDTQVYPVPRKKGYIISQPFMEEDHSVPGIKAHLQSQGMDLLVLRYDTQPDNFVSTNGTVYLLDPTKGPLVRFVTQTGLMSEETYRRRRVMLKKFIRRVKRSSKHVLPSERVSQ